MKVLYITASSIGAVVRVFAEMPTKLKGDKYYTASSGSPYFVAGRDAVRVLMNLGTWVELPEPGSDNVLRVDVDVQTSVFIAPPKPAPDQQFITTAFKLLTPDQKLDTLADLAKLATGK